jgi:hypothetical protein
MSRSTRASSPAQASLLFWISDVGAVTAEALAALRETTISSARAQLPAAAPAGLLARTRPLAGEPAIYTLARAGMRSCGLPGSEAVRVSHANAGHLIACARVAAALARCYPDHVVLGECALRRLERETGSVIASAVVGRGPDDEPLLHRPDLVLGPVAGDSLPIAVEVELTVKAPRRLAQICRAWARCRDIAGVLYLAAPPVERALGRAIAEAGAHAAIIALPLRALAEKAPRAGDAGRTGGVEGYNPAARTVAGRA